ncbi:MAG TPA: hypothetical protein VEK07_03010 [Polyangiaceae bacterium]|nr:hypothetical protein [Polyangiaceae bacterium]
MKLLPLSAMLRHVVSMQLAAMAPTLLACGGESPGVIVQSDAKAAADDGQTKADAATCQVTSTVPLGEGVSSCGPSVIFSFNGTAEQCALADGTLDCPNLCPEDAGAAVSCMLDKSQLECIYGGCPIFDASSGSSSS